MQEQAAARARELIDELAEVLGVEHEAMAGELSLRQRHLTLATMILDARAAGQRQSAILDARGPGVASLGEEHGAALEALAASMLESAHNLATASASAAELVRVAANIEVGPMSEAQAQLDVVREGGNALAATLVELARATAANHELAARLAGRAEQLREATREAASARELSEAAEAAIADSLAQLLSHERGTKRYRMAALLHALGLLLD